jgi:VanZ family protein
MGFIFYVSSVPGSNIPPLFPFQDIVFHLAAYLALGLSFSRALKNSYSNITLSQVIVFTIIFGTIYGMSDELHQAFVPYRTVSGFDVFTDGVGTFLGAIIRPFIKI